MMIFYHPQPRHAEYFLSLSLSLSPLSALRQISGQKKYLKLGHNRLPYSYVRKTAGQIYERPTTDHL